MACKFYAAMTLSRRFALLAPLISAFAWLPAWAENADRSQPLSIEADQPGTLDLLKRLVVFNGNVVVVQGSLNIRAERVEVREGPAGQRSATALGSAGRPAGFRQKREGLDEIIEGRAERIEYDSGSGVVRLAGHAEVRRLRSGVAADEISGSLITYDSGSETLRVQGAAATAASAPGGSGGGRVRVVISPRSEEPTPPATATPRR